jgi:hypothetical protein
MDFIQEMGKALDFVQQNREKPPGPNGLQDLAAEEVGLGKKAGEGFVVEKVEDKSIFAAAKEIQGESCFPGSTGAEDER